VSWQTARQREKEVELLFAGAAIREAIALYYKPLARRACRSFRSACRDLLQDPRYPDTRRYLRRILPDPMTGEAEWETIAAPDGGIMGVHSRSGAKPVKTSGAIANGPDFDAAATYADWKFVYLPDALPVQATGAAPAPAGDPNAFSVFSPPVVNQ